MFTYIISERERKVNDFKMAQFMENKIGEVYEGTIISVSNLFYNTPVRYKFLKKDYTEAGFIEDTVKRIALVNKNVAIKINGTNVQDFDYAIWMWGQDLNNANLIH